MTRPVPGHNLRTLVHMDPWAYDPWTGGESGVPEWAVDDPDLDSDSPFRKVWPASLDDAMLCLGCGAQVDWRGNRDRRTGRFVCPACGHVRPSHNASKRDRIKVGERDGWVCHRCGHPVDQNLTWPHPLSPVADHHPVPRDDGGPATLANLKIAHALCNGNTGASRDAFWEDFPPDQRRLLEIIVRLPLDRQSHVRAGAELRRKRAAQPDGGAG